MGVPEYRCLREWIYSYSEEIIPLSAPCWHSQDDEQPKVVGYVLGRMEDSKETSSIPPVFRDPTSRVPPTPPSSTGHVTSLAVLPGFRRHGVASRLMSSLHAQVSAPGFKD